MTLWETYFTSFSLEQYQFSFRIKVTETKLNFLESGEKHRRLSIFEKTQIGSKDLDEMIKFIEIVTLGPGKSFGELALIKSSTRAARVIWKEDWKFAVLNKDLYQNVLRKIDEQNKEDKINFLKQIPLFKYWSKNALGKLWYAIEVITWIRGQKIIKEGDPSDYVYLIK